MAKSILIVKHLPKSFTKELCSDFFKNFGAVNTRFMGHEGRLRYCAFVEFQNEIDATGALNKLHQLSLLNTTLVAEYSKSIPRKIENTIIKNTNSEESNQTQDKHCLEREKEKLIQRVNKEINSISHDFDFQYTINPNLFYSYPKPTTTILLNIMNALASVPKFYVQVLHLMNKMNLPAPFGQVTSTPEILNDLATAQGLTSSEESEYDSSGENNPQSVKKRKRPKVQIDDSTKKKIKLQLMMQAQIASLINKSANTEIQNVQEVFERAATNEKSKKIDIKIKNNLVDTTNFESNDATSSDAEKIFHVENDGFGKILPEIKKPEKVTLENEREWKKEDFVSKSELDINRLPLKEYKTIAAFKNYKAGEPSCRLYLKNLSKNVCEGDLHRLFGRYVAWDEEEEKSLYDIRLMKEGRMKGQAFVSLPSEQQASLALSEVNGYLLHGKPIAIHFARSAKLKTS